MTLSDAIGMLKVQAVKPGRFGQLWIRNKAQSDNLF